MVNAGKSGRARKFAFFMLLGFFIFPGSAFSQAWQELGGDHFIVYYTADEKSAKDVLDKAEVYYRDIATELGYPRYSEFWSWDKRVKIYIYPERESFLKATGQPKWSEGMADYRAKAIISYAWSQGFVESLLPHEMAHLIFRDFVGFKGEVPLWLDEGVAQWSEELKRAHIKAMARQSFENDALLSLEDMMKIDIRRVSEVDKVYIRSTRTKDNKMGILFLSGDNLINTYYLQSVSLVGFLIERYGSLSFSAFCRELRDGKSLEEAIRSAYGEHMRSLPELESEWREYLTK
jgi:hypothetical protein